MKFIFVLSTFICTGAIAQSANEILRASENRIRNLKNISYNIYFENSQEKITADVIVSRGNNFPIFETAMIKVAGLALTGTGSKQISFAYNGSSFDFIDPQSHEMIKLENPNYNKLGRTGMMYYTLLALPAYWQNDPFRNLEDITAAELMEDTTIFAEACYKIKVTRENNSAIMGKQSFISYWFIGKKDNLSHGYRSQTQQQLLRVNSTDTYLDEKLFMLAASQVKTMTGLEPLNEGLLPVGTKAPLWTLPAGGDKTISLSSLKGKIILLDFWGTWCVPCIKAMPDIQAIYDHFKGREVEVIGVSVEPEKSTDPLGFMKKKNFSYQVVLNGTTITKQYNVQVFPSLYLIDRNGTIIHAEHSGNRENFKEDIISKIEKALAR